MMPLEPADALRAAIQSEQIKAMQTPDYLVELLTLVREIHAMLKELHAHTRKG